MRIGQACLMIVKQMIRIADGNKRLSSPTHVLRILTFCTGAGLLLVTSPALGWGKRGHHLIADNAAQLLVEKEGLESSAKEMFRNHAYDLGYYSNVPDLVWKKPATYESEWTNHFMDLEIFLREFGKEHKPSEQYLLSREEFDKKFAKIPQNAGRSYWRIRELLSRAEKLSEQLRRTTLKDISKDDLKKYHQLQLDWLVSVGTMAHYIGDLSQPLHVTENYDGQLTEQKGIHRFFEDDAVDHLGAELAEKALNNARKSAKKFFSKHKDTPILTLLEELTDDSNRQVAALLKIDKKVGRQPLEKAAKAYETMLIEQLAKGSLYLAEVLRRAQSFPYHGEKFYSFSGEPEHIKPGSVSSSP